MNDLIVVNPFSIGDVVTVGEFFWIPDEHLIGWDEDAQHGNGPAHSSGSVNPGCTLTIRGIEGDYAIVRLDRPGAPCGARASIGTVFKVALHKMQRWPVMVERSKEAEQRRGKLAAKYCQ